MPWVHAAYFCKDMQRLDRTKCWNTIPYGDSNEICRKKKWCGLTSKLISPHLLFIFQIFLISRFSQFTIFQISRFSFLHFQIFSCPHFPDFQFLSWFTSFLLSPFSWFSRFFLSSFPDIFISYFSWFPDFSFLDFWTQILLFPSFAAFLNNFFRLLLHEKIWWTWWCTRPTTLCQLRFSAISWKQVCFSEWSCHRGERGWCTRPYNTLPIEIQCYFMKASLFLSKLSAQEYALFLPLPWILGPKNA